MVRIIYFLLPALILLTGTAAYAESLEAQLLSLLNKPSVSVDQVQLDQITDLARRVTNDELKPLNFNQDFYKEADKQGRLLSGNTFWYYWVLAYGEKHGTFDQDQGEHRYLGYTAMDESYTNWLFRPDFEGNIQIDQADWIEKPEKATEVDRFITHIMGEKGLEHNNFDLQRTTQKYRENIAIGLYILSEYMPEYYRLDLNNLLSRDWENYVHILQPPSRYSFGTGRMFRRLPDGSMRYLDVPLLPDYLLQLDLSAGLKEESFQGSPGGVIESRATFGLNKEASGQAPARLRLYLKTASGETELPFAPVDPAQKLDGNSYTFQPGEKLEVGFSFTVPGEQAEIVARVDHGTNMRYRVEKNLANNEDRAPVLGRYDLGVKIIPHGDIFTAFDGEAAFISYGVRVTRKDSLPGEINVSLNSNGEEINLTLGPGEREISFNFHAGPGDYEIYAEAWPVGKTDAYPPDNRDSKTITVQNQTFAPGKGVRVELIDN